MALLKPLADALATTLSIAFLMHEEKGIVHEMLAITQHHIGENHFCWWWPNP